ncbi:MAG: AMP-binding protein [Caulobacterales bacterium]|nr:AMP-binding protein [Caulobacterales bacterium]
MDQPSGAARRDRFADVPCRPVDLPPVNMRLERRPDGTALLTNEVPLPDHEPRLIPLIERQAAATPHATLYAERDPATDHWRRVSFAETWRGMQSVAQWLLDHGGGPDAPALIISGNSIAHAVFRLGAVAAGVPVCPVSENYALMGGDFARLRHVDALIRPRFIFAEHGAPLAPALAALDLDGREIVSRQPDALGVPATAYEDVLNTPPDTDALRARAHLADPDAHALYMLTSGTTGMPKAVIHTQRMLVANGLQANAVFDGVPGWHGVMLDWLPWSHVSGATVMMSRAAFGGGLYIDDGRPTPALFAKTIRNLREVPVGYFANMPVGYTMLADALGKDAQLRASFFKNLHMLLYGGAGLSQDVYERIQELAVQETGHRIFFTTGYGATETTSGCMSIFWDTREVGVGLPLPGVEVKLVPNGDRYEVRMRGDIITPGYLRDPERTAEAFDEEGFYKLGDTARFHDPDDVSRGLVFAGRLAEEFKLGTGTWVKGGEVRARVNAALAPAAFDIILCGEGRDALAVLAAPNPAGLAEIAGGPAGGTVEMLSDSQAVRAHVRDRLSTYNAAHPGRSERIARFAFTQAPLNPAAHELSDKGTINQAIASQNRADEIDHLYADTPPPCVIDLVAEPERAAP